jgi:hypothetical protein
VHYLLVPRVELPELLPIEHQALYEFPVLKHNHKKLPEQTLLTASAT